MNLKLMTLNTHSLHGEDAEKNMRGLCDLLVGERPDVVALQEVNQTAGAPSADTDHTEGYYRVATCVFPVPIKKDNFAAELVWQLSKRGAVYHFCWLPVKLGYGRFDEGLAILSSEPIESACGIYISKRQRYDDWRTRMALLMRQKGSPITFCNIHTSRYDDVEEPFDGQWKRLCSGVPDMEGLVIMGDLNCPAEIRGEGYDRVCENGFFDLYRLADVRAGGRATVVGKIDGWKDGELSEGGRIDHIFTGFYPKARRISYCRVLDGERGEAVSDHFGVLVNIEGLELDF